MHAYLRLAVVVALAGLGDVLAAPPMVNPRAPHFATIIFPIPGFLLVANSTATNATVPFQYSNGERADNTTCSVSLANDTAVYLIASNVTFYNSYFVNVTLEISFANFTDGNYTLIAQELFEGDVESELTQPFAISHDAYASHPTSLDNISFSATSTVDVLPTTTIDTDLSSPSPSESPQTSASGDTVGDGLNSILQSAPVTIAAD